MVRRTLVSVVIVLVLVAFAAAAVLTWQSSILLEFKTGRDSSSTPIVPTIGPKNFADGIGIYYFNEDKYNFLIWKKNLLTPAQSPSEKDIAVAATQAIAVKKGVKFYSYGIDFSKLGVVPPYALGFCIVRDGKTVDGVFPIRIIPVEGPGYIYELVPPPLIDDLSSGKLNHLFWAINDQYSCKEGWVFKFQ